MKLQIFTPERPITSEEVDEVTIPGALGEFGILPGHTTFLSALGSGPITYKVGSASKTLEITGGFCEVHENHVTVLADSAN